MASPTPTYLGLQNIAITLAYMNQGYIPAFENAGTTMPSSLTVYRKSPCHSIPKANSSTIPAAFVAGKGITIAVSPTRRVHVHWIAWFLGR